VLAEALHWVHLAWCELALFAAVGFLVGGIDDFLIDLIWLTRWCWRGLTVYRAHKPASLSVLEPTPKPEYLAFLIPAWDEANVIFNMLQNCSNQIEDPYVSFFVGCYRNDPLTIQEARRAGDLDSRIQIVLNPNHGPTTKADCLNKLWQAIGIVERLSNIHFGALVLHDAEDFVHPAEPRLYRHFIRRFDFVQIPVLPLVDQRSHWIAGHYCDEFAETHGKLLVIREAIGAALPAAGVGCAFSRELLEDVAEQNGGAPFKPDSLTEDYELGLSSGAQGYKGAFVRIADQPEQPLVAVRAHFPATLDDAVRQKARWIAGIALSGWDRLGWSGGLSEFWMRVRDRRAPLAALVLCAGYAALLLYALEFFAYLLLPIGAPQISASVEALLQVNGVFLLWRLTMRAAFVAKYYGWQEALRSVPRALIANIIAIMAARRSIGIYLKERRSGQVVWDKTSHIFPVAGDPR
jgi:bacteriophage N4 adsorption protein B